ncbi:CobW family GTP-binding protein [Fodinicurvata fenggangensis]|uniref:CobW family GTP-binding protein n=1 Tax=Fodinicurvata fenggangensis TaxID=1121830 RepID=UPI00047A870A|nr:GTP-binding protein [Fodinicurvata fenggangensis]
MSLIPVSILTGFLGSGKTTLLRHLLSRPELSDTAVIVNEFGEVGLDHVLVADSEEQIVELNSGCLCCTVRWDLVTTLDTLFTKRESGEIAPFSRVVIETTGLADPAPVLHTLMNDPKLAARFRLDGVITVIDGVNGLATLDRHEEAVKQAAVADRLVITKSDLPEAKCAALEARLENLNPGARQEKAVLGDIAPDVLFGAGFYALEERGENVRRWLQEEAYRATHGEGGHDHDHHENGHGDGGHDVNRHDDRIRAFSVVREEPVSVAGFTLFLELLVANRGPDILRVKGIVNIEEKPEKPAVIHGVQHLFHPVVWMDDWPDADRSTRLVFITRDVSQQWIEKLLDSLTAPREAAEVAESSQPADKAG